MDNYAIDLYIALYCGKYIKQWCEQHSIYEVEGIDVIMNIGSLHVFKELK
jgi:hypothetical protein